MLKLIVEKKGEKKVMLMEGGSGTIVIRRDGKIEMTEFDEAELIRDIISSVKNSAEKRIE